MIKLIAVSAAAVTTLLVLATDIMPVADALQLRDYCVIFCPTTVSDKVSNGYVPATTDADSTGIPVPVSFLAFNWCTVGGSIWGIFGGKECLCMATCA